MTDASCGRQTSVTSWPARAERDGFQHVLSRADAAIHPHLDALSDGLDDRRQRANRRRRTVELPAAMVGNDERIGARIGREASVLRVQDALQDQFPAPAL